MAEREKETIVTTDGGGGGGGTLLAVVLLIALLVVLFLVFGRGLMGGGTEKIDADIKVDTPATGGWTFSPGAQASWPRRSLYF